MHHTPTAYRDVDGRIDRDALFPFLVGGLLEMLGQQGAVGVRQQQNEQGVQRLLLHSDGRGESRGQEEGHPGGETKLGHTLPHQMYSSRDAVCIIEVRTDVETKQSTPHRHLLMWS